MSEVISALSFALDLTEGQPPGHAVRCCVFGIRVAEELGLAADARADLYYASLMKDAGCSTNASKMFRMLGMDEIKAKRDVKTTDWTKTGWESLQYALGHVKPGAPFPERMRALVDMAKNQKQNAHDLVAVRCERGAAIARRIGLREGSVDAIYSLDELWSGIGQPEGRQGEAIPMLSRIMNLAQTVDVFFMTFGPEQALEMARKRSGRWFDPEVVKAFESVAARGELWADLARAEDIVVGLEPRQDWLSADDETIDKICLAFADVIDAKSPFTYRHSTGVTGAAVAIARTLSLPESDIVVIRRAALLHDVGKLSVSNAILDKPGKLTDDEWGVVKQHPYYTYEVLNRIPGFDQLSEIAASHHEKLDGSGYFRHLPPERMSVPARILVVADIYDALAAKRPYRDALPFETVIGIMQKDAPKAIDANCFEALKCSVDSATQVTNDLLRLSLNLQHQQTTEVEACESEHAA
ncbi:MAG: HD domain-containing phosphohydrolase [Acidobacteriota bacterium]